MNHVKAGTVRIATFLCVGLLAGCGSGGGSGGGSGATPPGPAPVLVSFSITPSKVTLDLDGSVTLDAIGTYSDASLKPVAATWQLQNEVLDVSWTHLVPAPAVAQLTGGFGTSVVAKAMAEGTIDVRADVAGMSDTTQLTAVWNTPSDPGPVYGAADEGAMILKYPSDGGAPVQIGSGMGLGFMLNRAGTALYSLTGAGSAFSLERIDLLNSNATSTVATYSGGGNPICLDTDSNGLIYTLEQGTSTTLRLDNGASTFAPAWSNGTLYQLFSIGPDGSRYYNSWLQPSLFKYSATTGTMTTAIPWASIPGSSGGYSFISGIATNRRGETFAMECNMPEIYKCVDLNGDGNAQGPGETVIFAQFPGAYADNFSFGMCTARGGGLVANLQTFNSVSNAGIYWFRDLNDDGDARDANERVLYNPNAFSNASDAKCIACPR